VRRSKQAIEIKSRELETLATTDALSGLLDRRVAMERGESGLERARGDGTSFACVMCDISSGSTTPTATRSAIR